MTGNEAIAIDHQRFGRIEVPSGDVIHFDGLPGFADARRFALLRHDRTSTFLWLISLDHDDLAFVVTDPRQFFPDYDPALANAQLRLVDADDVRDVELFAMATIRDGDATLNLAAPLVVHAAAGKGAQLILEHGGRSTREPLPKVEKA